jgi:hypothetical protein
MVLTRPTRQRRKLRRKTHWKGQSLSMIYIPYLNLSTHLLITKENLDIQIYKISFPMEFEKIKVENPVAELDGD